jgi:hypothetical protein
VPDPRQRAGPFRARHHEVSGKIPVGYIESFAVQSGPRNQDFKFFSSPKETSPWKKFDDNDEVQDKVMMWFKVLAANFYDSGIQKLVPRLNKNLDNDGEYVEK